MALFNYQALSKDGKKMRGSLDAASVIAAREQLSRMGLYPIDIVLAGERTSGGMGIFSRLFVRSVSLKDKILFTKQLSVLLKSGIALLQALELLTEQFSGRMRTIIIDLKDGIKEGQSLAEGGRTDEFIPLEERTAIANREQADLFLSIHANASADARARGIETYFLNFAPNPQAEAIAARENAGSGRAMGSLPDIVKAIALNNKLDESRDFASLVQTSMVERLRKAKRAPKNLGVKQAPFVVLVGATMPSVLAEISFVTNRQEQAWLKTGAYRQQLAEALLNGITRYQKSLTGTQVATTTR